MCTSFVSLIYYLEIWMKTTTILRWENSGNVVDIFADEWPRVELESDRLKKGKYLWFLWVVETEKTVIIRSIMFVECRHNYQLIV